MNEVATAQNSPFRAMTKNPIGAAVEAIDRHAPWVTPDGLTWAGTVIVLGVDALEARNPELAPKLVGFYTLGNVFDILDGALARFRTDRYGIAPSKHGGPLDAVTDKAEEALTPFSLAIQSEKADDPVGAVLHTVAGMTSGFTAVARAYAEKNGVIVKENGLGSRPPRAVANGIAKVFGKNKHVSRAVGATSIGVNVWTTHQRVQAVKPGSRYAIGHLTDPEKISSSNTRFKVLAVASGAAVLGGSVMLGKQAKRHRARAEIMADETLSTLVIA